MTLLPEWDVIILGAGASGLMCAMTAGARGRRVLVLDHAKRAGEKIRISGGGHCNFTNLHATHDHYLSANPRFCQSALRTFTPEDFLALLKKQGIRYHEKVAGQMFCDGPAEQIVSWLLKGCQQQGVRIELETTIQHATTSPTGFTVTTSQRTWQGRTLVIALGGRARPKLGATGLGYDIARRFGLEIIPPRPGLTPLTWTRESLQACQHLAGLSVEGRVTCNQVQFTEGVLFTHQGLSGPAILQISSYWQPGDTIHLDLLPDIPLFAHLKASKASQPRVALRTALSHLLPKRLAVHVTTQTGCDGRLAEIADNRLKQVADAVNHWPFIPGATQGYARAEVSVGGVDTRPFNPNTLECKPIPGLYCIGELLDVTGWLGGFNLQWAWSSGQAAGRAVCGI